MGYARERSHSNGLPHSLRFSDIKLLAALISDGIVARPGFSASKRDAIGKGHRSDLAKGRNAICAICLEAHEKRGNSSGRRSSSLSVRVPQQGCFRAALEPLPSSVHRSALMCIARAMAAICSRPARARVVVEPDAAIYFLGRRRT